MGMGMVGEGGINVIEGGRGIRQREGRVYVRVREGYPLILQFSPGSTLEVRIQYSSLPQI